MPPSSSRTVVPSWSTLFAVGLLLGAGCDERALDTPEHLDLDRPVVVGERDLLFTYDLRPPAYDFAWIEDLGAPPDLRDGAASIDLSRPDLSMPDTPDLRMPDLSTPDLRMPDLSTPDLRMPDLSTPDLRMPDLSLPDLTVPPDLRPPVDMALVPPQFAAPVSVAQNVNTDSLVTGDFNGDGKRDIVYCDDKKGELNPLFGNGDGTFKAGAAAAAPCGWYRFEGFDFDKDGRWDVYTGSHLARGNANGTFTVTKLTNGGSVADADGDGNIDLVSYVNAAAGKPNVHYFKYNNGDFVDAGDAFAVLAAPNDRRCGGALGFASRGSFACWVTGISAYLPATGSPGSALSSGERGVPFDQMVVMRTYDADLDGQPDGSGLISKPLFQGPELHAGGFFFSATAIALAQGTNATFAVYDVNGDGFTDIVGTSQSEADVVISYVTNSGNVQQKLPFNLPVFGNAVGLADFDGDKKIDIAVAVGDAMRSTGGVLLMRGL